MANSIDTFTALDAEIKRLTALRTAARTQILELDQVGEISTANGSTVQVIEAVRWSLDQKALKEEFGEDWIVANSKPAKVVTVKAKSAGLDFSEVAA